MTTAGTLLSSQYFVPVTLAYDWRTSSLSRWTSQRAPSAAPPPLHAAALGPHEKAACPEQGNLPPRPRLTCTLCVPRLRRLDLMSPVKGAGSYPDLAQLATGKPVASPRAQGPQAQLQKAQRRRRGGL
eukprot:CAMPEP_0181468336 /NCGR_PEP_ID=MMETSP1110-20121109/37439_1 /TAXON_ID=174948 /ORGANISM="Symbiodinium sp., Strain CCMP421" /LENGTH=127 /DNA_ID=CAMNT_0023593185 /DNA_START=210 /DNA_END=591 /DNA_ORIENTATION=+